MKPDGSGDGAVNQGGDTMRIRIDDTVYEGTGVEIMEKLRDLNSVPEEYPTIESYIRQLQTNYIRSTGKECILPNGDTERMARVMFAYLARAGALEMLDDG